MVLQDGMALDDLGGYVDGAFLAGRIAQHQAQGRLGTQRIKKVLDFCEGFSGRSVAIDAQYFVAWFHALGFGIAAGANSNHITAFSDQLRLPTVIVEKARSRRHEESVGIVQRVEESRYL